jgi:MFS family permease
VEKKMQNSKITPYFMWLSALSFFAFQFILRLWIGINTENIMQQFNIGAELIGKLASSYNYGYSLSQIPMAILLDKFGGRRVLSFFAIICGIAHITFALTTNFELALYARFMIGVGSACGFLGVSKILTDWFSRESYSKMIGYSFTIGLLGAIYGGRPVASLLISYKYQEVAQALGIVSVVIGILCFAIIRDSKRTLKIEKLEISGCIEVLKSPFIWGLAVSSFLLVGVLEAYADVWGVSYLINTYNLEKDTAAGIASFVYIGMLFGGPILAYVGKKIGDLTVVIISGFILAGLFQLQLASLTSDVTIMSIISFILGIFCCYQVLVFAIGTSLVTDKNLGFTVAFINSINMLGGAFFHTIIGKLMSAMWKGEKTDNGVLLYPLDAYTISLSSITYSAIVGSIILLLLYKTHKRITNK